MSSFYQIESASLGHFILHAHAQPTRAVQASAGAGQHARAATVCSPMLSRTPSRNPPLLVLPTCHCPPAALRWICRNCAGVWSLGQFKFWGVLRVPSPISLGAHCPGCAGTGMPARFHQGAKQVFAQFTALDCHPFTTRSPSFCVPNPHRRLLHQDPYA